MTEINLLTAGRKALLARLETITQDNGYLTDAGSNVRSGWMNEVLKREDVGFPLVVVQYGRGKAPEQSPGVINLNTAFDVVGAVDVGLDEYEAALEDLMLDLFQALIPPFGRPLNWMPKGIAGVLIGASEMYPPGNGERAAIVRIPVTVKAVIRMK
ncbi:hypothetical protein [Azomonas macrocytogenes]|uniref:Uncharacterized protein n=1 Tax=Azomonas macrocytogenes TaxID=69962 RepID=A0A839T5N3_AZOMA|nr:hypothetical protein [Azomonas macrocytogenes]MBB3103796.1 hypothetical protein [Azomonas macrocytogenes]